jgi:hypothetical protein
MLTACHLVEIIHPVILYGNVTAISESAYKMFIIYTDLLFENMNVLFFSLLQTTYAVPVSVFCNFSLNRFEQLCV